MTIFQAPSPTSTLQRLLDGVKQELNWGPTFSDEMQRDLVRQINRDIIDLSTEFPHFFLSAETEIPVEPDFVCDSANEDDRVFRHDNDAFVLQRESSEDFDDWPTDDTWNSRWIEVVNEDGDKERRRIRDVWKVSAGQIVPILYMTVDRALTITGDDLQFRVYIKQYPLPHNFMHLVGVGLRRRDQKVQVTVGSENLVPGDVADPDNRSGPGVVSDYPRNWWEGPPEEIRPPEGPTIAELATGQGAPTWDGADLPGTFQYAAALAWGVYKDQSRADETWTLRPYPRYLSILGEASAEVTTTAGGAAIKLLLPDISWLEGWGGDALNPQPSSPADIRWGRNGLRWYIFRRRVSTAAGNAPPHTVASMQRYVPADGSWCLWRVEKSNVRLTYDRGTWPPPLRDFRPSQFGFHKTLIPGTVPLTAGTLALRYHAYPDPLVSASDSARMTPGTEQALIYKVAANIANQQGRPDTWRSLLNEYYRTCARHRADAPVTAKVTRRIMPRVY